MSLRCLLLGGDRRHCCFALMYHLNSSCNGSVVVFSIFDAFLLVRSIQRVKSIFSESAQHVSPQSTITWQHTIAIAAPPLRSFRLTIRLLILSNTVLGSFPVALQCDTVRVELAVYAICDAAFVQGLAVEALLLETFRYLEAERYEGIGTATRFNAACSGCNGGKDHLRVMPPLPRDKAHAIIRMMRYS